jgi:hypothetical protein
MCNSQRLAVSFCGGASLAAEALEANHKPLVGEHKETNAAIETKSGKPTINQTFPITAGKK